MEFPCGKKLSNNASQRTPKVFILLALTLIILGIIPLHYTSKWYNATNLSNHESEKSSTYHIEDMEIKIMDDEACDISIGEWIPNPDGPYYTNTTCWAIHEHQNCMKYGRPDIDFLKWRYVGNSISNFNVFSCKNL